MKNVINNIASNIAIQHVLAEFQQVTCDIDENITICKSVYSTAISPVSKSLLGEVFKSVIPFNTGGDVYYQIARPKEEYISAIKHCVEKSLINKWVQYFCVREAKYDTQIETGCEQTRFISHLDYVANIQDTEWTTFIEYLQEASLQEGKCSIAVSGFTLEELQHDPYIAALAREFQEIYLIIQKLPCKEGEKDFKVLEINHNF